VKIFASVYLGLKQESKTDEEKKKLESLKKYINMFDNQIRPINGPGILYEIVNTKLIPSLLKSKNGKCQHLAPE
jgi:hypothetical protein